VITYETSVRRPLFRRNCFIDYRFEVDGSEVIVDVCIRATVFNYSTSTRPYRSKLGLDAVERPDILATKFVLAIPGSQPKVYGTTEFESAGKLLEQKHTVKWESPKKVQLAAQDITRPDLKPACSTEWAFRRRMPLHFTTIESVALPTIGMTVRISAPKTLTAFCVETSKCVHGKGSDTWEFPGLLMPDQHIRLYWYPNASD
jgi:hypothetical protein